MTAAGMAACGVLSGLDDFERVEGPRPSESASTGTTGGQGGQGAQGGEGGAGGNLGGGGMGGAGGGASCTDTVKNGNESDVDCGGSCPNQCAQGQTCGAETDCATGFCADGVCCNTACGFPCESCSAALKMSGADGECGQSKEGVVCGDVQSCSNGTQIIADVCDTAGGCLNGGTDDCAPYVCDPMGLACLEMCAADADCTANNFCNAAGSCVLKKVLGQACMGVNECQSGFCADGVCCESACDAACRTCDGPVSGSCTNITAGTDPPGCVDPQSCSLSGACQ